MRSDEVQKPLAISHSEKLCLYKAYKRQNKRSYIAKNEWICGITASYTGFNSDDSDLLLLIKDFNFVPLNLFIFCHNHLSDPFARIDNERFI